MFQVTDDSGFLALIVPAAYDGFVDSDWTLDQILSHFRGQMSRRSLLIWGTGLQGCWNVEISLKKSKAKGFRETTGPLRVVGESLLLTNYESLSMAAQFEDVTLPEKHQNDLLVALPDGDYYCRIIQMFDPGNEESSSDGQPDFVIEIHETMDVSSAWDTIPWFEKDE